MVSANRQVPKAEWRALHEAYGRAEELDVAEEPVKDYLNRDVHDTSPRIAYVRALLTGLCNPNELTQRQLTFVAFLLERWASKVGLERVPSVSKDLLPLAVDLAGDDAPERIDPSSATGTVLRYLDTDRLAKSLRNRVGLLRKGESRRGSRWARTACSRPANRCWFSSTGSGARCAPRVDPSDTAFRMSRRSATASRRFTTSFQVSRFGSRATAAAFRTANRPSSPPSAG